MHSIDADYQQQIDELRKANKEIQQKLRALESAKDSLEKEATG